MKWSSVILFVISFCLLDCHWCMQNISATARSRSKSKLVFFQSEIGQGDMTRWRKSHDSCQYLQRQFGLQCIHGLIRWTRLNYEAESISSFLSIRPFPNPLRYSRHVQNCLMEIRPAIQRSLLRTDIMCFVTALPPKDIVLVFRFRTNVYCCCMRKRKKYFNSLGDNRCPWKELLSVLKWRKVTCRIKLCEASKLGQKQKDNVLWLKNVFKHDKTHMRKREKKLEHSIQKRNALFSQDHFSISNHIPVSKNFTHRVSREVIDEAEDVAVLVQGDSAQNKEKIAAMIASNFATPIKLGDPVQPPKDDDQSSKSRYHLLFNQLQALKDSKTKDHEDRPLKRQKKSFLTAYRAMMPLMEGKWTRWTKWTECSSPCKNGGTRTRKRTCMSSEGTPCDGPSHDNQPCNQDVKCKAKWREWSDWGPCSVSCGNGYQARSRTCLTMEIDLKCKGTSSDLKTCHFPPCKVELTEVPTPATDTPEPEIAGQNTAAPIKPQPPPLVIEKKAGGKKKLQRYQWSVWGRWSRCSESCGKGHKSRIRVCVDSKKAHPVRALARHCGGGVSSQRRDCQGACSMLPAAVAGKGVLPIPDSDGLNVNLSAGIIIHGIDDDDDESQLTPETIIFITFILLAFVGFLLSFCIWLVQRNRTSRIKSEISSIHPFYRNETGDEGPSPGGGIIQSIYQHNGSFHQSLAGGKTPRASPEGEREQTSTALSLAENIYKLLGVEGSPEALLKHILSEDVDETLVTGEDRQNALTPSKKERRKSPKKLRKKKRRSHKSRKSLKRGMSGSRTRKSTPVKGRLPPGAKAKKGSKRRRMGLTFSRHVAARASYNFLPMLSKARTETHGMFDMHRSSLKSSIPLAKWSRADSEKTPPDSTLSPPSSCSDDKYSQRSTGQLCYKAERAGKVPESIDADFKDSPSPTVSLASKKIIVSKAGDLCPNLVENDPKGGGLKGAKQNDTQDSTEAHNCDNLLSKNIDLSLSFATSRGEKEKGESQYEEKKMEILQLMDSVQKRETARTYKVNNLQDLRRVAAALTETTSNGQEFHAPCEIEIVSDATLAIAPAFLTHKDALNSAALSALSSKGSHGTLKAQDFSAKGKDVSKSKKDTWSKNIAEERLECASSPFADLWRSELEKAGRKNSTPTARQALSSNQEMKTSSLEFFSFSSDSCDSLQRPQVVYGDRSSSVSTGSMQRPKAPMSSQICMDQKTKQQGTIMSARQADSVTDGDICKQMKKKPGARGDDSPKETVKFYPTKNESQITSFLLLNEEHRNKHQRSYRRKESGKCGTNIMLSEKPGKARDKTKTEAGFQKSSLERHLTKNLSSANGNAGIITGPSTERLLTPYPGIPVMNLSMSKDTSHFPHALGQSFQDYENESSETFESVSEVLSESGPTNFTSIKNFDFSSSVSWCSPGTQNVASKAGAVGNTHIPSKESTEHSFESSQSAQDTTLLLKTPYDFSQGTSLIQREGFISVYSSDSITSASIFSFTKDSQRDGSGETELCTPNPPSTKEALALVEKSIELSPETNQNQMPSSHQTDDNAKLCPQYVSNVSEYSLPKIHMTDDIVTPQLPLSTLSKSQSSSKRLSYLLDSPVQSSRKQHKNTSFSHSSATFSDEADNNEVPTKDGGEDSSHKCSNALNLKSLNAQSVPKVTESAKVKSLAPGRHKKHLRREQRNRQERDMADGHVLAQWQHSPAKLDRLQPTIGSSSTYCIENQASSPTSTKSSHFHDTTKSQSSRLQHFYSMDDLHSHTPYSESPGQHVSLISAPERRRHFNVNKSFTSNFSENAAAIPTSSRGLPETFRLGYPIILPQHQSNERKTKLEAPSGGVYFKSSKISHKEQRTVKQARHQIFPQVKDSPYSSSAEASQDSLGIDYSGQSARSACPLEPLPHNETASDTGGKFHHNPMRTKPSSHLACGSSYDTALHCIMSETLGDTESSERCIDNDDDDDDDDDALSGIACWAKDMSFIERTGSYSGDHHPVHFLGAEMNRDDGLLSDSSSLNGFAEISLDTTSSCERHSRTRLSRKPDLQERYNLGSESDLSHRDRRSLHEATAAVFADNGSNFSGRPTDICFSEMCLWSHARDASLPIGDCDSKYDIPKATSDSALGHHIQIYSQGYPVSSLPLCDPTDPMHSSSENSEHK